jgi:hypothetical protein
MCFCNPVPIAKACYLGKDVVEDTLAAFVEAVKFLTIHSKIKIIKTKLLN